MKKTFSLALFVFVVALCIILLSYWRNEEGFCTVKPLDNNEDYVLHESELVPRDELTEFLVTKENIVLFYDYPGMVNVYALNGTFLYGLQVQTLQNGRGSVAHDGNYLYVHSRGHKLYVFDGPELVQSLFQEYDSVTYNRINCLMDDAVNHSLDGITYYYNSVTNAIEKAGIDQPIKTVIGLPQKNPNISFVAFTLLLCVSLAFTKLSIMLHKTPER